MDVLLTDYTLSLPAIIQLNQKSRYGKNITAVTFLPAHVAKNLSCVTQMLLLITIADLFFFHPSLSLGALQIVFISLTCSSYEVLIPLGFIYSCPSAAAF